MDESTQQRIRCRECYRNYRAGKLDPGDCKTYAMYKFAGVVSECGPCPELILIINDILEAKKNGKSPRLHDVSVLKLIAEAGLADIPREAYE